MIQLQRLNGESVYVNPDLIKFVEEKPDVTLTFSNGDRLVVRNSPLEIETKIIQFKRKYQTTFIQEKEL